MLFSGKILRFLLLSSAALSTQHGTLAAADTPSNFRGAADRRLQDIGLSLVPVVGGVTTSSAKIQVRTDDTADVKIEYSTDKLDFGSTAPITPSSTTDTNDFTTIFEIDSLAEDETYYYRVLVNDIPQNHIISDDDEPYKFSTMPASGAAKTCEFAVFSDVNNDDAAAPVYGLALENGAKLAFQIGDFNHGNPYNPKGGREQARNMHKLMRNHTMLHGYDFASNILANMPLVHMFDDHDFCGNDSDGPSCNRIDQIVGAFKNYYPSYDYLGDSESVDNLIAQDFSCGDAEIFLLDTRTQRAAEAADAAEAATVGRSMLGPEQLAWLQNGLLNSQASWKIIISTVTASVDARDGTAYDNWSGFEDENNIMYNFIHDNSIKNVLMISGDIHTGGGIDNGWHNRWGIPEMTVAHTNLQEGTNTNNARPGSWSEGVTGGSFSGYSLVTVTENSLEMRSMGDESASTIRHSLVLTKDEEYQSQISINQELVDTIFKFEALWGDDFLMKAKFIRLGFHDCVGGCDGCIDANDHDNAGLDIPIDALLQVVEQRVHLSRADIWAAAALWAAGSSQRLDSEEIDFSIKDYYHTGRVDCEDEGHTIDAAGAGYSSGPMGRHLPIADLKTAELVSYFAVEFGYDMRETVVIMGAHTMGKMFPEHSGFNSGEHGWVQDDQLDTLDNTYYNVLVGPSPTTPDELLNTGTEDELLYDGLDWDIVPSLYDDGTPTGNFEWEHFAGAGTIRTIMTSSDIALARDLDGTDPNTGLPYMDADGDVSCLFKCKRAAGCRTSLCPAATETLRIMSEYKDSNELFVEEFRDAFVKMLMNKYAVDPSCTRGPCALVSQGLGGGEACTNSHQCESQLCEGSGFCASNA